MTAHALAEMARREIPGLHPHDPAKPATLKRYPVRVCAYCGRHVIGEGYESHGLVFCSWSHHLVWLVYRDRGAD